MYQINKNEILFIVTAVLRWKRFEKLSFGKSGYLGFYIIDLKLRHIKMIETGTSKGELETCHTASSFNKSL